MKDILSEAIGFHINESNLHFRAEQIRARLKNYLSMLGGQAVLLLIFDWMMWGVQEHAVLLAYNAAWVLVAAVEIVWWWRNRERVDTIQACMRWHYAFIIFTGYFALFWGATVVFMFPEDLIHQILLLMLLLGLAGASVSTNTVYPLSFYIWIVGVLVPPILKFSSMGDAEHWAIAGFITLYFVILIKSGAEVSAAFSDTLHKRFDNEALVKELRQQQVIINQTYREAEISARTDYLTGMNNRRAFYDIAKPLWSNAIRNNRDASIILMDLDLFKLVNDTYGHDLGDKVLVAVASALKGAAREGDVIARWGGEEFILLLSETSLQSATIYAERLRTLIAAIHIDFGQTPISITASFGVSQRVESCLTLDELTSSADKCLYQAKADGRNRVSAKSNNL